VSWLSKFLPPKSEHETRSGIPDGVWTKCEKCREIIYAHNFSTNLNVCPSCGWHHYFSARDRINTILLEGYEEIAKEITTADPIAFKDQKSYPERILQAQLKSNENEALITACGYIKQNQKIVLAVFEFKFIGGSMGSVVGEKFVRAIGHAVKEKLPFVCIATSGGARMQEGLFSLMQMAKTTAALHLLSNNQLPFISLITNPTMGGVSASFVFLGDIVFAEPGSMIGFAGPRVIEQTIREALPDRFQTAEFLLEKGAIDSIIDRRDFKVTLIKCLDLLLNS
jgi:acetyl-CoA carboxylase carboxyl transferase subunit beta